MGQSHEHQLNLTVGLCNVLLTYFRLPGTQLRIEPFSKCEKRRKKVFYVNYSIVHNVLNIIRSWFHHLHILIIPSTKHVTQFVSIYLIKIFSFEILSYCLFVCFRCSTCATCDGTGRSSSASPSSDLSHLTF